MIWFILTTVLIVGFIAGFLLSLKLQISINNNQEFLEYLAKVKPHLVKRVVALDEE